MFQDERTRKRWGVAAAPSPTHQAVVQSRPPCDTPLPSYVALSSSLSGLSSHGTNSISQDNIRTVSKYSAQDRVALHPGEQFGVHLGLTTEYLDKAGAVKTDMCHAVRCVTQSNRSCLHAVVVVVDG